MPKDTVPAAEFMRHSGLVVYHIYKNDDINDPVREYWYSLWEYGSDNDAHGEDGAFGVRELPGAGTCRTQLQQKRVISKAIDAGYFDDWAYPEDTADGQTYGEVRKKRLAAAADVETVPVKLGADLFTWEQLAEKIAALTPEDKAKQVRYCEPYDDSKIIKIGQLTLNDYGDPVLSG